MKRALIFGYGISGRGAERLLRHLNYAVEIAHQSTQLPDGDFDLAVLSPGIPPDHFGPCAMRQKGVEVIGEVELALRHLKNRCIGVTGTNGKTTLVKFLAHVLKGKALGNIGESIASYAADPDERDLLVIELSSFQLETLKVRALDCAVITNITPDHLDRYSSFEAYADMKWQIGNCLKDRGVCFIPEELKWSQTPRNHQMKGFFPEVVSGNSYLQLTSEERYWIQPGGAALLLASAVCERFGVSRSEVLRALKTFEKLPHRLERVCEHSGVVFVNDSKSTNPSATLYAVYAVGGPTLLIVGGESKGLTFEAWRKGLGKNVKAIFTIGKAGAKLKEVLSPLYKVHKKKTLHKALSHAFQTAEPGDTILLSPGCASFDQFENYAHRGEVFKTSIQQLWRDK